MGAVARLLEAPLNDQGSLAGPESTMRGKINFLGSNTAVRDHRVMQLRNGLAAGFDEHEWKEGMDKTSPGTQQHLAAEPGSPQQMSPVGLPD